MVLLSAVAIGAVAYAASQKDQEPAFDIENKTSVDLMPLETDLTFFEPPVSTITFFDGNADDAAAYLRRRIDEVVKVNPWLGGWLHRSKGKTRIWYDPEGKDLAPNLFREFEAGDIGLTRDTPYQEYENLIADRGIQVKRNEDLMGRNEPIWSASLVPDADKPGERFALIVSMSHVCGDAHTHYAINDMLNATSPIVSLNAERKFDYIDAAKKMMGEKEASYIKTVTSDPLFKDLKMGTATTHIFSIGDNWLRHQKFLWSGKVNTKMQSWLTKARSEKVEEAVEKPCWGFIQPKRPESAVTNVGETVPTLFRGRLRGISFAPSTNDILVSSFWRTVDASVGLMLYDFRNRLINLTDNDAGNYIAAIPYTPEDYKTPKLIQKSVQHARRAGADKIWKPTTLPRFSLSGTNSISSNWNTFSRKGLTLDGSSRQTMHLPMFFAKDISIVPSTLSYMIIFNVGPAAGREKLGALVVAPASVMEKVDSSGIVGKTIARF